jgi:hypothetical protein
MKNFTLKLTFFLCIATLFFSGCNTNDDFSPKDCDFSDADSKAYYDVAMKFSSSPTRSNCNTLRQASYNLIKKFEKCAETKQYVSQLTAQWDQVDCNSL